MKRSFMSGLNPSDHDLPQPAIKRPSCTPVNEIQKIDCKNSIQEMQKMANANFHDNIKCCPEYVCTCCDQLWYRTSVRKCEANKYPKCSKTLLKACITTTTSMDNTKWIYSTLRDGRLPDCSKANKMGFFVKAHCSNLTPLEKKINFSTYFIYSNIRELPIGGQLSMHGNVFKRECPGRPREITKIRHMLEKLISLIFCSEIPHDD